MLSFVLTFYLFALTHTHLIHVHLLCLTVPGNKRHGAPAVFMYLWIYTEHPRPHVLLKGTEWLQQSVSVENLHGNKSYNLSPVCTLDWLRAITLTKKEFLPPSSSSSSLPSTILPALCQINPPNFPKDLRLFPFFCLRMQPLCVFFPSFSDMAPGRGDCLPNETAVKNSQCLHALSPSLFYLTPLPHLTSPTHG